METTTLNIVQRKVFYGWIIIGVAFIGFLLGDNFAGLVLSVFLKPMSEELGWTRTLAVGPLTAGTLAAGLASPLLGRLVDRHGAKGPMVAGAIAAGGALILTAWLNNLWQFFLFYGIIGGIAVQMMGGIVATTTIANWFIKKRGRAFAIATMGVPIGATILVPLAQYVIAQYGWRTGWLALGLLTWSLMVIPASLLVRRRPEDMGLRPDGEQVASGDTLLTLPLNDERQGEIAEEPFLTPRAAFKTPNFWLITAAFGPCNVGAFAILVHLFPYLLDKGMPPNLAAAAMSVFAFTGIPARILWGFLAERIHIRYVVILNFIASGVGFLGLVAAKSEGMAFLAALLSALGMGGGMILQSIVWPNYFGRRFVGSIRGFASPLLMSSTAAGPLLGAWLYDTTGRYLEAFLIFAAAFFSAAFLMSLAKPSANLETLTGKMATRANKGWGK